MKRREFVTLLGGVMAVWPVVLRAQQRDRLRRIGVLSLFAQDDPQGKIWEVAFRTRLKGLGWVDGSNLEIQARWAAGDLDRAKAFAKELIAFNPDLLLGITTPAT